MSGERAPECFQALLKLLDSTSKVLAPWSFQFDPVITMSDPRDIKIRCDEILSSFPVDSWRFLIGIVESNPERIRIWMVCNVNESMAKELQLRIDRCNRSFVWLERIKQRFSAMDPDNRDEPRMARIMAKCCERSFWSFLGLETFIGDLCAAMGWKRSNGESGDGKPLAQQVETKVGSLPEAALNAIVAGGLAGVLNEAVKISAVQRYSQTMMKMLEDSSYYEWGLKDWVDHLKAGRKTILLTPAWAHIKRWREENKRERLSE